MSMREDFQRSYFPGPLSKPLFELTCGEYLGGGVSREVFVYNPDPTCVIKFEASARNFQNVMEWDLWKQHWHAKTSVVRWLAPCVFISDSGDILIQKLTKDVPTSFKLPKKVPKILNDLKRSNWGLYKGNLVCRDYGRHNAIYHASGYPVLEVAEWDDATNGHFDEIYGQDIGAI